jgi:multiple sugar transport system substrate-binding protein
VKRFAAAFAALATIVAACAGAPGTSPTPTVGAGGSPSPTAPTESAKISYLTHWGPEQVAQLEAAATAFTAANPGIEIEVRSVPFGDLLSTIRTQAASPSGPTISSIYNLWLPELVKEGVAVAAPADVVADVEANWPSSAVDGASVDGTLYGYPNEINTYALNYNKRLFSEAGIAEPPKTWDELVDAAKKLTKKDGDTITQQGIGLINSWAAGVVHPYLSMTLSDGGNIVDGTTPTLDSAANMETMKLYERLVKELGVTDPSLGTANATTTGPFLDNFTSGKTGMIIMANWWQSSLKAAMGDSFADIATAPIPVGPNGEKAVPVSYEWLTTVNAKADPAAQAAAWKFLTFLHAEDSGATGSGMGEILIGMGIIPSRTSDTTAFADQLSDPFLKTYVDSLADAAPFPVILGGQELTEMLQKKLEAIEFGELTADQAASEAQTEAEQILSQFYP